jgi:YebC/PmpR family DNA-binding regulatory protein
MAGHSHWAGIKHKKARVDAQRGKIFSKLSKRLIQAARGGSDPEYNFKLRRAIEKAQSYNMPKDKIENAVKKGAGELPGFELQEIVYEGYSKDGIAIMADALTENTNITTPEIRHIFEKRGGSLGSPGSVAWKFKIKGLFIIEKTEMDEDEFIDCMIDAGLEDYVKQDTGYELYTDVDSFSEVQEALDKEEIEYSSEITKIPQTPIEIDSEQYKRIIPLMEELEDHDDVQDVYADFDVSDEVMAEAEKV